MRLATNVGWGEFAEGTFNINPRSSLLIKVLLGLLAGIIVIILIVFFVYKFIVTSSIEIIASRLSDQETSHP